ncbi:MAG: Rne/Rng family ribonuclease [Veillonellaceae bacterium]|nr:Rne/Rng family ribonuclease [Veillonellaceae bacterium]
MNTMILAGGEPELVLALLADGELTDLATEDTASRGILQRVYKGVVKNVVAALDACFVDIGIGVNAYLPLLKGAAKDIRGRKITEGASVLVQVTKEARGTKGPMVTTKIRLAGHFALLLAGARYVGVSKKIATEEERERLRSLLGSQLGNGDRACGFIVRTAAAAASNEEILQDVLYLRRTYDALIRRAKITRAPALVYREADLVLRAVRDYLRPDTERIITDNREIYERLAELVGTEQSETELCYEAAGDLLMRYGIRTALRPLLDRRVDLPGGGYLVIDATEALTAIDVNSGTFRAGGSREELAERVNREAAAEAARQIRLRNIGGIILIDFIDMVRPAAREAIMQTLRAAVAGDRVRTVVVDMTPLGLVELTRRKTGAALAESRLRACTCCGGTGYVRRPEDIVADILAELHRSAAEKRLQTDITIHVHPQVWEYCHTQYPAAEMRRMFGRNITWEARAFATPDTYMIGAAL